MTIGPDAGRGKTIADSSCPSKSRIDPLLVCAAIAEAATGLGLILLPVWVSHLLLGSEVTGLALVVARVAGIALVGLSIACWPGPALNGMIVYGGLMMFYLGYLGATGTASGPLLWPAVALHGVLTAALLLGKAGQT